MNENNQTMTTISYLIDELTTMVIVLLKDVGPQGILTTTNEVAGLMLEHAVLVGDVDQFIVALALFVTDVGKVRITFLAVFANETRVIILTKKYKSCIHVNSMMRAYLVLLQEWFRVIVGVDVDLGKSIVHLGIRWTFGHTHIQPGQ